jgi:simple sugar transport system ATP-binding protein
MMEALSVRHIVKKFPNVVANDDVSISIEKGEIFAIVGENGAGKSTLMKIVY